MGNKNKWSLPKIATKYQNRSNNLFKGITDLNNKCFESIWRLFLTTWTTLDLLLIAILLLQSGGEYGGNGGYGSQNRGPAQTPPLVRKKDSLDENMVSMLLVPVVEIDPVIGRDEEIIRVIENSTVGAKTTLSLPSVSWCWWAWSLAQKIDGSGDVPHKRSREECSPRCCLALSKVQVSGPVWRTHAKTSWKKFVSVKMSSSSLTKFWKSSVLNFCWRNGCRK